MLMIKIAIVTKMCFIIKIAEIILALLVLKCF